MSNFPLVADISSYQPSDQSFFNALKAQGVKAVIVKLTQGSADGDAYVNPKAQDQINHARQAGLLVHGYHYARFNGNQDAVNEAKWFYQHAHDFGLGKESVLAVDVEDGANAQNATSDVNAFLQSLIDQGHQNIDVYSMASWFWNHRLEQNQLLAKNLWVANYCVTQPGVDNVGTWQFTNAFQVAGVGIDMSYDFHGYYTQIQAGTGTDEVGANPTSPTNIPVETWVDELGDTWQSEHGYFLPDCALPLRYGAKPTSDVIAMIGENQSIVYDAWSRHDGFVWLRQPRANQQFGYMACRNAQTNEPFGEFCSA